MVLRIKSSIAESHSQPLRWSLFEESTTWKEPPFKFQLLSNSADFVEHLDFYQEQVAGGFFAFSEKNHELYFGSAKQCGKICVQV
jgi:hypothetical protein